MMLRRIVDAFVEGFVGALRLYVDIVIAPFSVVKAFIVGGPRDMDQRSVK